MPSFKIGEVPFNVLRFPEPKVEPALEWVEDAQGRLQAIDRGASQDVYTSKAVLHGTDDELNAMIETVAEARGDVLELTDVKEYLFLPIVNHAVSMNVAFKLGRRVQVDFSDIPLYQVPVELRAQSPTLKTTTPSLASLRPQPKYEADSSLDAETKWSYAQGAFPIDGGSDSGRHVGFYRQYSEEMEAILRFVLGTSGRNASFTFPAGLGIDSPFGPRSESTTCRVRLLEAKRRDLLFWDLKLEFPEA